MSKTITNLENNKFDATSNEVHALEKRLYSSFFRKNEPKPPTEPESKSEKVEMLQSEYISRNQIGKSDKMRTSRILCAYDDDDLSDKETIDKSISLNGKNGIKRENKNNQELETMKKRLDANEIKLQQLDKKMQEHASTIKIINQDIENVKDTTQSIDNKLGSIEKAIQTNLQTEFKELHTNLESMLLTFRSFIQQQQLQLQQQLQQQNQKLNSYNNQQPQTILIHTKT